MMARGRKPCDFEGVLLFKWPAKLDMLHVHVCMMCDDVWCMVYGVWCMIYDVQLENKRTKEPKDWKEETDKRADGRDDEEKEQPSRSRAMVLLPCRMTPWRCVRLDTYGERLLHSKSCFLLFFFFLFLFLCSLFLFSLSRFFFFFHYSMPVPAPVLVSGFANHCLSNPHGNLTFRVPYF
ncbi:hypothetical protein F4859DRAFT_133553 [Xylaria cf. heliscus]|nr:hypothetical protein F4859DRAFT_133553 [Xylaria cf. heliscus]